MKNEKIIVKLDLMKKLLTNLKNHGASISVDKYGKIISIKINKTTFETKVVNFNLTSLSEVNKAYKSLAHYWVKALDAEEEAKVIKDFMSL